MAETWKPIPGWEDLYKVSDQGKVWSIRSKIIMKTSLGTVGYPKVKLCNSGKAKHFRVHELVWKAFGSGKFPVVRHLDGNPLNNCIENLKGGTYQDNSDDVVLHGTRAVGDKINTCKLTPALVREIRAVYAAGGIGYRRLAKRYGVTRSNIKYIVDRTTWRHVS